MSNATHLVVSKGDGGGQLQVQVSEKKKYFFWKVTSHQIIQIAMLDQFGILGLS